MPKLYSFDDHPEHKAQLDAWAQKWIANALSTRRADEGVVREAVAGLYRAANLEPPARVVMVDSPIAAAIAGGVAAGAWYLRRNPDAHGKLFGRTVSEQEIMSAIAPACALAVRHGMAALTGDPLPPRPAAPPPVADIATDVATRVATDFATASATRNATDVATHAAIHAAVDLTTRNATADATRVATSAATADATDDATRNATYVATDAATRNATRVATYDATYGATDDATDDATYAATRVATYAATRVATDAATRDATDAATDAATSVATNVATNVATRDATRAATNVATNVATRDATRAAAYAATNVATNVATRTATDDATNDATDAATRIATATRDATRDATETAAYVATRKVTDLATRSATRFATGIATDDATYAATDAATRTATDDATNASTRTAISAATRNATYNATYAATRVAASAATNVATNVATRNATRIATRIAADAATRNATDAATFDATDAATDAATRIATDDVTNVATYIATRAAIDVATRNAIVRFYLNCVPKWSRMYNGGSDWSSWCSYLSFFDRVANLDLPVYGKWRHYETLALESATRITHPDFCIVSHRQASIHQDATEGRPLHNATGPARAWADGWAVWYWHGTRVPRSLIEGNWTVSDILNEQNTEIRRCAIEKMGWDEFIVQAGLKRVGWESVDPGNPGNILALYDIPPGLLDFDARILLCTNATPERDGTRRRFGLTVPANIASPVTAAAWTFGLSASEYSSMTHAY